jgi:hypothetical protein
VWIGNLIFPSKANASRIAVLAAEGVPEGLRGALSVEESDEEAGDP